MSDGRVSIVNQRWFIDGLEVTYAEYEAFQARTWALTGNMYGFGDFVDSSFCYYAVSPSRIVRGENGEYRVGKSRETT